LSSDAFDVVVSLETLHLLASEADRDEALHQIGRVLRPGGLLVATVPVETGAMALVKYVARRVYGFELSGCDLGKALRFAFAPRSASAVAARRGQVGFDAAAFVAQVGRHLRVEATRSLPARWCPTNLLVAARKPLEDGTVAS
jgi:SAM-dependent methyltransferase